MVRYRNPSACNEIKRYTSRSLPISVVHWPVEIQNGHRVCRRACIGPGNAATHRCNIFQMYDRTLLKLVLKGFSRTTAPQDLEGGGLTCWSAPLFVCLP